MLEKHFDFSIDKPDPLKKYPRHEAVPDPFLLGQQNVGSDSNDTTEHELVFGLKAIVKSDSKDPHKQSKHKKVVLGFRNKRVGRLISRSLCNQFKPYLSSINMIEINEDSNPEIEDFLTEEDPYCHKSDPNNPYDYVNNIPLCLKDNKGFTSIKFIQGLPTCSVDVLAPNYMLPRHINPVVQYKVFLH
jgi:hypothetical protein